MMEHVSSLGHPATSVEPAAPVLPGRPAGGLDEPAGLSGALEVSAVVCTYDESRWPWLERAVASLQAQRRRPAEVIVVVDHNPALLERVRRDLPDVVAIENRYARGLSGGRNSAIEVARSPVVAFLDDDASASADWLDLLMAHLTDPRVAGAGSAVVPDWASARPGWFPPEFDWVLGCSYEGMPRELAQVRNPFGGAMVVRRELLESVGGYRTDLGRRGSVPLGCEETELCLRIRGRAPETVFLFDPGTTILHHVPSSRTTWRYFRRRCYAEGLSKAVVRAVSEVQGSLSTEQAYVTRTLARGVGQGLAATLRGEFAGLGRAAAIVTGLFSAAAGYAVGRVFPLQPDAPPPTRPSGHEASPDPGTRGADRGAAR